MHSHFGRQRLSVEVGHGVKCRVCETQARPRNEVSLTSSLRCFLSGKDTKHGEFGM